MGNSGMERMFERVIVDTRIVVALSPAYSQQYML